MRQVIRLLMQPKDICGEPEPTQRVQESGTGRADGAARGHADITAVPVDVLPPNLNRPRPDIVYRADHTWKMVRCSFRCQPPHRQKILASGALAVAQGG